MLSVLEKMLWIFEKRRKTRRVADPGRDRPGGQAWADAGRQPAPDLKSLVRSLKDEAEMEAIRATLEQTHWNRKEAAQAQFSVLGSQFSVWGIEVHPCAETVQVGNVGNVRILGDSKGVARNELGNVGNLTTSGDLVIG
jgi:hypothetical protein